MRFLLATLVASFGAAAAVDIFLFPSNSSCLPYYVSIACTNVEPRTCCRPPAGDGSPFFNSAECRGLRAGDTCAIARVAGSGAGRPCGAACTSVAAAADAAPVCASADRCWGYGTPGFGAYWVERSLASGHAECAGAVDPDRVAFASGRAFRINYGVPAEISALLVELVKTDPQLSRGVPAQAAQYEIREEKELTPEGQHVLVA